MPINTSAVRQKTLLEFLDYDYYGVVKLQPNVAMPSEIGMAAKPFLAIESS